MMRANAITSDSIVEAVTAVRADRAAFDRLPAVFARLVAITLSSDSLMRARFGIPLVTVMKALDTPTRMLCLEAQNAVFGPSPAGTHERRRPAQ